MSTVMRMLIPHIPIVNIHRAILVGALDGFVDEDVDYAMRLNHAGVAVELHVYPGAPHGFDALLPNAAVSKQANADIHAWIAKHYAH